MIDIQLVRDNPDFVKKKSAQKNVDVDVERLLDLDKERKDLLQTVEELRARRNEIANSQGGAKPSQESIDKGKQIKIELAEKEGYLSETEAEWYNHLKQIPNIASEDSPIGDESKNEVVKQVGDKKTGAVDHLDFALEKDWIDFDRGAKVAGSKFYFLKGDLALLENALTQFALNFVVERGFTFLNVPHLVNSRVATGTGFAPRTSDQTDEYFIDNEDLSLIATAEMPLTGLHADEIVDKNALPLLYAGLSPCYRKEAGTYGKHTRGLFRVHQFNKLEMYALTSPEDSEQVHQKLLQIQEELWQTLNIPYQVVNIATGDLGSPAAKKYDLEYWSRVDGKYRELTSCSNCTDFQSRNLQIKLRDSEQNIGYVHTLNGTAVSLARSLVALIENYQKDDGRLMIPEVLRPYMSGRLEI